MFNRIIDATLAYRWLVLIAIVALVRVAGAADLRAAAVRRSATAGTARDRVRRALSVHAVGSAERPRAQRSSGVGDQGPAAHGPRRERSQHLGRADEAVSARGRSHAAHAA